MEVPGVVGEEGDLGPGDGCHQGQAEGGGQAGCGELVPRELLLVLWRGGY